MRLITGLSLTAAMLSAPNAVSVAAAKPSFQLNETSWTFVDSGTKVKAIETIDAKGNYIENAVSGKHIDHGTAVVKDGKACFTSAMTTDGEMCWTVKSVKIGQSTVATNDKGQKLRVKRVKFTPLKMPK